MREKKIRGISRKFLSLVKIMAGLFAQTFILERNDGWEIDTEY